MSNQIGIDDEGEFIPVNRNVSKQAEKNVNLKMLDGIHTGQVKWFNRRRGYGFITIIESKNDENNEQSFIGKDVFVHQSHIKPKKSSYRSLEENEYVEFQLSLDDKNVTQAINITGLKNGTLLCDALRETVNNDIDVNNTRNLNSIINNIPISQTNRHRGNDYNNKNNYNNNRFLQSTYENSNSFQNLRK